MSGRRKENNSADWLRIKAYNCMGALPPVIFYINGDISYPAAAYFIGAQPNNPTSYAQPSELTNLQTQLFIDDTMTKAEFDARVVADPSYPIIVHLRGLRILVILPDFYDLHNRHLADIVLFLHQGMADVETNRFWHHHEHENPPEITNSCVPCRPEPHFKIPAGPPGQSYDMQRLTIYELLRARHECGGNFFLPFDRMPRCDSCRYPFYCDKCHTFSGMRICFGCQCDCVCGCGLIDNQGRRISSVHLPNCDNEVHNEAFIHRK